MIDEKDLDQPWIPPGAWQPKIGERVRVRLSGECRVRWNVKNEDGMGHHKEFDGLLGEVLETSDYERIALPACHQIVVMFDERITFPRDDAKQLVAGTAAGGYFALSELEPVDATP